jgi:CRP/FNR family transcriptional regulator, cyclic AMP receptor protein
VKQFTANRDNVIVHRPDFWGLLGEADRKDLISAARSRVFPPGGILCTQGEPTTHVFILRSGWVKVITDTPDGRQTLEALRREGEIVGEIAGQVTGYRTATVQALGTVHALLIGTRQLGEFLDSRPVAAHAYRQAMAEVQQVAYEKQRSRDLLSGAQRLAGLLLDLTEQPSLPRQPSLTEQPSLPRQHGQANRAAAAPQLMLSQEELASLIGASRSTVTRALQGWRSRHIIGTDQRRLQILDRARLQRIADRDSNGPLSARGKPVGLSNAPHEPRPLTR